jgi:hypothetical protein
MTTTWWFTPSSCRRSNRGSKRRRTPKTNRLRQIERFEVGAPLDHVIDRAAGY